MIATGDGDDTIQGQVRHVEGSPFDDRIVGRAGSDLLYAGVADSRTRDRSSHVLIGGEGADNLVSESGDDRLHGGGGGNDILQGGSGVDVVRGGAGDDTIHDVLGFSPGQVVDGGAGSGDRCSAFALELGGRFVRAEGVIDLAVGYLRARAGARTVDVEFTGMEDVEAPPGRWRLIGALG